MEQQKVTGEQKEMATQAQINLIRHLESELKIVDKGYDVEKDIAAWFNVKKLTELSKTEASQTISKIKDIHKWASPESKNNITTIEQPTMDKFAVMEQKDEQQIMQELEGRVLDEYVYSFKQGGQAITGLSWCGIKRIVQKMGDVSVRIVSIDDIESSYRVVCEATNHRTHLTMCGVSEQKKFYDAECKRPDQFALQKAMSKAQRNALRNLIPEPIMIEMIKEWREGNK